MAEKGNGILMPTDALPVLSMEEMQRRGRKITVGEAEDVMNHFRRTMIAEFAPLAHSLRELHFRTTMLERNKSGGDVE